MKWYEHVTEAKWFKALDNPATKVGHLIVTATVAIFAVVAFVQNPNPSHDCSSNPLRGVYNPKRLQVVKTCFELTGTVVHRFHERDGDLHIQLDVQDKSLLRKRNYTNQSGYLVVEYLPSDPYPVPKVGDKLDLHGTYVLDKQHGGWTELHPVFSVQPLGQAAKEVEP